MSSPRRRAGGTGGGGGGKSLFSRTAPSDLMATALPPAVLNGSIGGMAEGVHGGGGVTVDQKLDHNNMVRSMRTSGPADATKATVPKMKKTAKPPPMKPFPGGLIDTNPQAKRRAETPAGELETGVKLPNRNKNTLLEDSIVDNMLSVELQQDTSQQSTGLDGSPTGMVMDLTYGGRELLTSEELMRHPDYLKIDQSKLALESFDNVELEAMDRKPTEWLVSNSSDKTAPADVEDLGSTVVPSSSADIRAQTPYYHSGEWIWRPVQVRGYDQKTNEFLVRFLPNGIEKRVKRLNLQFDAEDPSQFTLRREMAEQARENAKSDMRLDFFIEQQPMNEVRVISKRSIRRIHERIIDGLPLHVPFPEPDSRVGRVLRALTSDVIHFYTRTMKRSVLYAKLRGAYKRPDMILKCKQLRLPPPPVRPPVPFHGKVECPLYPYNDCSKVVETRHYSGQRDVLNVYRWLATKWCSVFQYYNFFDVNVGGLNMPCKLSEFMRVQTERRELTSRAVQRDLHRACMDQFMDCVQDSHNLFQSEIVKYEASRLKSLFRVVDMKLATMLRSILLASLHTWQSLVVQFTDMDEWSAVEDRARVEEEEAAAVRAADDLERLLADGVAAEGQVEEQDTNGVETAEAKPTEEKKTTSGGKRYVLAPRRSEISFPLCSRTPLFQVELVVNEGSIRMVPSLEDIQESFSRLVDNVISDLSSLVSIEKDIMSLLVLEPRLLFNVSNKDPLFVDMDSAITRVKNTVAERVFAALQAPLLLTSMYNEYVWLLAEEPNDYVASFLAANPDAGVPEYTAELDRLHVALTELGELSFTHETFSFVRLSATAVNRQLTERAKALRQAMTMLIANECRQLNVSVVERYQAILARIGEKPSNERQLADLRDFIESSKATVAELKISVAEIHTTHALLQSYKIPLPIEDVGFAWSTLEYPSKVEHSGREVEIALEADKVKMMDRLALQKDNFEKEIEVLSKNVKAACLFDDYTIKDKVVEQVNALMDSIQSAMKKGQDFNMRERVFNFVPTDYSVLDRLEEELNPFYKLWNHVADFHNSKSDWLTGEFKDLDGSAIDEVVTDWWKTSYKLAKGMEDEFPGPSACAMKLRDETTAFRRFMPVIQALASKALKPRHWDEVRTLLSLNDGEDGAITGQGAGNLTLQALLDADALSFIDRIQEVTTMAEKEYNLDRNLRAMIAEWTTIEFEIKPYKESGTFIVGGGIDEIVALLDDHIVKTQTMRGSPYIKNIEKETRAWEHKLKYAQALLDELIQCQRTWMYLEPIFSSEDIIRQLPTEARRFQGVDQLWRKTLADAAVDANFMSLCEVEKRLEEKFKRANEKLEEISKGLNDYLELKRLYFPRFFFLSNDELLEILSQTKEPRAVQPHLGKCFEGINRVKFESDLKITEIISAEGEVIALDRAVDPETPANKGNVEKWLLEIESVQWESIRSLTVASLEEYPKIKRGEWILHWPAQVILGVSSLYWTQDVTESLRAGGGTALLECNARLDEQLKEMVRLVRGKLSKLERKTLGALTTIDVHNRDVVAKMVDLGTCEVSDFEWMSQLRYYWEDAWKDGQAVKRGDKTLVARIVNARCLYGYEYLGNTMRLVITALTDRCYRTMIGAIDLLYGGAPEGPAGTGKTETVKDLSKAMAIHCVVFNCSDGLDYLAMAKFFKGLAGCGSWCCFDEFNRINIEVLSVIAQQILVINQGKREAREMFHFEGTYMKLNSNCNVFITMNPGYAGRAELPDNLKALFRPCAMMVPDYAMIGEIRLYSFGFEAARENAQKIVRVLQLSSEQLSSQKHYDYGMRAVNSILVAAGNLRQQLGDHPDWDEAKIVLRSINDVNLAKFLVEDLPLFRGITSDLFPGVILPTSDYAVLTHALEDIGKQGFDVAPENTYTVETRAEYIAKTIQLYEMVMVRHGVMIVGQTCSGKTAITHHLAKAMTKAHQDGHDQQFEKVQIHTINPKAVSSKQLYGLFDENTHEFVDGILAVIFRRCAKDTSPDRKWMMFDGPVDAVWIENMNTVLDDNKKLCLNSGEIIKMSDQMTMFFEAEDLEQASPATVSRVGMIFCETRNIGWAAVRNIWLRSVSEDVALMNTETPNSPSPLGAEQVELLSDLFDWIFPIMTYLLTKWCFQPTPMAAQELIFSMTRLLRCMLDFEDGCASDVNRAVEGSFFYALIWSVGACVDNEGRRVFSSLLRRLLNGDLYGQVEFEDFSIKNPGYVAQTSRRTSVPIPEDGLVYDYSFDTKTGKWVHWLEGQPPFKIPREAAFQSIVVPTIDTIRNDWVLDKLLRRGYHVLCTGDTGTGKSVTIKNKLLGGMPDNYTSISLNFSAQTSANQTQDLIDTKLDKRRKGVIGPPLGQRVVVFVDDLNMPAKEEYGAQPPIEILRQWMDHRGWYDRKENEFRRLVDIQFCAAMGPPGGGRTRITQRYVRHFNLINFVNFSDESLARVFGTILDWRLSQGFAAPIKALSSATVTATLQIYNSIAASLLPTPAKSHYTFNLRDLSKVFQGILMADATALKDKDAMIRLWAHECMRVFHDRLVSEDDREWFKQLLSTTVKDSFSVDFAKVRGPNPSILFCNFGDPKALNKPYVELADRSSLSHIMTEYMEDYNMTSTKRMSLVLFDSAVEHIARISRVINQPYGNALLVGVGGSGRKSLTTLAVHIADFTLFSIEITKSYGMNEWREDIKTVMNKAGVLNKPTVFMLDDTQLVSETFLEDINGILNTGEVANLFNSEDMSAIMEALAKPCQEAGVNAGVPAEVYNFFIGRVRTNLHLVLCLSPIGESFRTRLRMFPSLVNCCTIDWFTEWPEEALRSVANSFLESLDDLDATTKSGLVDVCVDMQQRVVNLSKKFLAEMGRHYYVTPTSYLELLSTFQTLLTSQRKEVLEQKARYDNGLSKLLETANQVNEMQVYLEDLQPKLQEATIETDALLVTITKDRLIASEKSKVVAEEARICDEQARAANELAESCQRDLDAAMPILRRAMDAVANLDRSDIVEMKAMKKPSFALKLTMGSLAVLFKLKPNKKIKDGDPRADPYWDIAAKELLGDSRFMNRLMDMDMIQNLDLSVVQALQAYVSDPDFEKNNIAKKGSAAAAGLVAYVHAVVQFDAVNRTVIPKREALAAARQTLSTAQQALAVQQAALKEVTDKVAELEAGLKAAEDKKAALKNQVEDCEAKLRRADALIKGLGGEKTRWTEMSAILGDKFKNVTGDIILSAGTIAYLGAFTVPYRQSAIAEWAALLKRKSISCMENFRLADVLGSPVVIREWVINKLPNDSFSIENAIMLNSSNRWPLMIDPQGQANKWVKRMEDGRNLRVVKQNQSNFVRILENAIQFGSPVLLENVPEYLDPILEPLLLKSIITTGGVKTIRLGDSTIEYDSRFRLYITTKLRNPHFPPELCVKVNLLNFMATAEGLQDQMLGRVVALEQRELEAQRQQLVVEDAENQRQLKEIEDRILYLLKTAEGNILDDEVLIDTLGSSKKTSNIIQDKVKIAEQTQIRIAKVREGYVSVAFQASQLFFCIADLAGVDPMYQYSLDWYISLFESSIEVAERAKKLEDRLQNLNDCFAYLLYKNVCRSLFEKDKLLFSFLLTTKIFTGKESPAERLDERMLRFFLQGSTSMELKEEVPFKWMTDRTWLDLLALFELPMFGEAAKTKFKSAGAKWAPIIDSLDPWAFIEELLAEEKLDSFERLCYLRCLRPDAVVPAVMAYVAEKMGTRFIEPPAFDMAECFADSKSTTPLIFVLTPGAAPMTELLKLAEDMGFQNKLQAISLGQGQGPIAENAITEASDKGSWVCLQNCHLSISWMPTLEKICEEFSEDSLHPNFRLWLTSEPSVHFPAFVLQNGVKMTNEPPKGMRANLLGSLLQVDSGWFDSCERNTEFKKMLFGLCFFHAAVRERRKFGPLGWNIQYVFSAPDLRISMDQLRIFLDELRSDEAIPYAALAYLVGECNYGGRVTDDKDRRCIMNILDDFYNPEIISDDYKFSPSGTYYAPSANLSLDEFREYVRSLPYNEGPEVFGLHDNANITCAISETNGLLDTALSLQSRSAGGEGKSWGEILAELARDISAKLPDAYDIEKALIMFPVRYEESMNTVLTQELIRFNRLLGEIRTSLVEVQKAIKGLVLMSAELEAMGNSMVVSKVPEMWAAVAYPSLKPLGSWVADLLERLSFLSDWMENGTSPNVFWISGFFFTQAFITGTLQNFARKHHIPIDKAEFDFRVLTPDEVIAADQKKPEDGAFVRGLFMEGARWDVTNHVIAESLPRELYVSMPYIHLDPKMRTQVPVVEGVPEQYTGSVNGTAHVYMCPVYKTSFRQGTLSTTGHSTNFVMFIRIPMAREHKQKLWIKRGVAMLTQLDI